MNKLQYILLIFIILSVLNSCNILGDGSNIFLKETANNNHSKKAVLFLREGGATVANSYQVSITDYEAKFDTSAVGNVFTVDGDRGKAILSPKSINFNWITDDTVEINYDKNLRTFIKEKRIDKITVIYKAR